MTTMLSRTGKPCALARRQGRLAGGVALGCAIRDARLAIALMLPQVRIAQSPSISKRNGRLRAARSARGWRATYRRQSGFQRARRPCCVRVWAASVRRRVDGASAPYGRHRARHSGLGVVFCRADRHDDTRQTRPRALRDSVAGSSDWGPRGWRLRPKWTPEGMRRIDSFARTQLLRPAPSASDVWRRSPDASAVSPPRAHQTINANTQS